MCESVKRTRIAPAVLVAALGTSPQLGCGHATPAPASSPSRLLRGEAPSFRRATVQGGDFDTASASGRVLIVDFFAAYCGPCRRSLPALQALHRRRPDLAVVGVSLDAAPDTAAALIARYQLSFPVVHDAGAVLAGRFRVTELPASFVADRAGRVAWVGGGDQPEDALARAVEVAAR
jgi:thiol-disulfide isomerase/thioredoxin